MLLLAFLLITAQASTAGNGAQPPRAVFNDVPLPFTAEELQRAVKPPRELLPVQGLFSPEAYPAAADGRRGTVGLKLIIDPWGSLTGCSVVRSSGSLPLDSTSCNIVRRRGGHYAPALDKDGKPSFGTIDEMVDWDKVFKIVPAQSK